MESDKIMRILATYCHRTVEIVKFNKDGDFYKQFVGVNYVPRQGPKTVTPDTVTTLDRLSDIKITQ